MRYCPHRYLYIFIIFTVLLGSWYHTASAQDYVDFPDENLAAAVRSKLGLADDADIPKTSLEAMTLLFSTGGEITNLTGLEYATGLTYLALSDNLIEDIMYCLRFFRPLPKGRLCYNTISLKGVSNGETKKLHP